MEVSFSDSSDSNEEMDHMKVMLLSQSLHAPSDNEEKKDRKKRGSAKRLSVQTLGRSSKSMTSLMVSKSSPMVVKSEPSMLKNTQCVSKTLSKTLQNNKGTMDKKQIPRKIQTSSDSSSESSSDSDMDQTDFPKHYSTPMIKSNVINQGSSESKICKEESEVESSSGESECSSSDKEVDKSQTKSSQNTSATQNTSLGTSGLFFSPLRTPKVERLESQTKIKKERVPEGPSAEKAKKRSGKEKVGGSPKKRLKDTQSQETRTETSFTVADTLDRAPTDHDSDISDQDNGEDANSSMVLHSQRSAKSKQAAQKKVSFDCPLDYKLAKFTDQKLWAEELENSELWLIKVPTNFQMSCLDQKNPVVGTTVPVVKDKQGDDTYQWQMQTLKNTDKENPFAVLLPSMDGKDPKFVGKFTGEIHVTKNLQTKPSILQSSTKKKHLIPDGLKMRNKPFGADGPVPQLGKNGLVCEALKRQTSGVFIMDTNEAKQEEHLTQGKKSKKKKKQKHAEKDYEKLSTDYSKLRTDIDKTNSTAAMKCEDTANSDSVIAQPESKSFGKDTKNIENESLKAVFDPSKKKKKSKKHKREHSESRIMVASEDVVVKKELEIKHEDSDIMNTIEKINQKKKKKHNKSKDKLDDAADVTPVKQEVKQESNSQESLDYVPVKKSKKKKHKHKKEEYVN